MRPREAVWLVAIAAGMLVTGVVWCVLLLLIIGGVGALVTAHANVRGSLYPRRCNSCLVPKAWIDFAEQKTKRRNPGRHGTCRECRKSYDASRHDPEGQWVRQLWTQYRLRLEDYLRLLREQGGRCAICRRRVEGHLSVDHDHRCCPGKKSCGKCVTGLLCRQCNMGLGLFGENSQTLRAAADYVLRRKEGV